MRVKIKLHKLLCVLLCCFMLVGMLPMPAYAWDRVIECDFCGAICGDDYICDGGDHCSAESGRSCYDENHCPTCDSCYSEVTPCPDCDDFCSGCNNEWCEDCDMCIRCAINADKHCRDCEACTVNEGCALCYRCFECGGQCASNCDDLCFICHLDNNTACDDCGACYVDNEDTAHCPECGVCAECLGDEICQNCNMCPLCATLEELHCLNCHECLDDNPPCPNCDYCKGCAPGWCDDCEMCIDCAIFEEKACPDCYACTANAGCETCGRCFDCGGMCSDGCDNYCLACHRNDGKACEDCEACFLSGNALFCYGCYKCSDCVDCDYCEDCEYCVYCAFEQILHCPTCESCYNDVTRCPFCDDICSGCGDLWCDTCEMCINCAIAVNLHCNMCDGCFKEAESYCENCYYCSNCVEVCPKCNDSCDQCDTLCKICGTCNTCVTINNASGLCADCEKSFTAITAVSGLKISSVSSSSLTLSWDKNDSATGYIIQQYKNGTWTHVRQLARNTVTSYTATGLAPSTTYQYRVRAYYTNGSTTTYSSYTTISGITKPSNMTGLKATSTSSSVTFSWDKNDSATGYLIQQYKDGAWTHLRQLARNNVLSYTATGLAPSTIYQFRIRAYYTNGSSTTYGDYTTFRAMTKPSNMTGLKATSTSNSVTFSWDKNDSATGYLIQQYKDGAWTHVRQLARNTATTYTATGLAPSTIYQFRIRAYYTNDSSTTYSDYTTFRAMTKPSNITGVKATSTANSVTISWDKNDSATGYLIQQYKDGAWTHVRQLAINTVTSYTATGLAPSTIYQFRIRAYYTNGSSTTYSDYTTFRAMTKPSNMTGLKATSTSSSVTFSWDKNSTATGYLIQQYKDGKWTHVRQLARNTATTYTATGLTPSTTYQYRIRAYYTSGTATTYSDYTTISIKTTS